MTKSKLLFLPIAAATLSCGDTAATDSGGSGQAEQQAADWSYKLITESIDFSSVAYGETSTELGGGLPVGHGAEVDGLGDELVRPVRGLLLGLPRAP